MKQITDKLNDIAKAIDPNVTLPTTNLITDSLDAITKAYGGTPTDSDLITDKLVDIRNVATMGSGDGEGINPVGTLSIKENGEYNVYNYRYADVDVLNNDDIPLRNTNVSNIATGFNVWVYAGAPGHERVCRTSLRGGGNNNFYVSVNADGEYYLLIESQHPETEIWDLDESSTGCDTNNYAMDSSSGLLDIRINEENANVVLKLSGS